MKKYILFPFTLVLIAILLTSCTSKSADNSNLGDGKNQASQKGNAKKEHGHDEQVPDGVATGWRVGWSSG